MRRGSIYTKFREAAPALSPCRVAEAVDLPPLPPNRVRADFNRKRFEGPIHDRSAGNDPTKVLYPSRWCYSGHAIQPEGARVGLRPRASGRRDGPTVRGGSVPLGVEPRSPGRPVVDE